METLLSYHFTTTEYILLCIIVYLVQLALVQLMIRTLNTIASDYGTTNVHYFLPLISVLAYAMILIEECYILYIKPRLLKIYNRIIKY